MQVLGMNDRKSFYIELLLAAFIIATAVVYVGRVFYFSDNSYYLNTTDALPIYSKAIYIAESLRSMEWPSWFPYWYCGTSVSQYYPPLVYIILGPLEVFIENPMFVLKIFIFTGLYAGGLGIWYGYNRNVGPYYGILAAALYVMLPYFTISFLSWGTVAQIPIVALSPWYMVICLKYLDSPKVTSWIGIVSIMLLLLMSHIMHGFMIALSIFITMAIFAFMRRVSLTDFAMWVLGTALSAGLFGFWWLTGVFRIENPDIPSLASENIESVTANLTWFFPEHLDFIQRIFPDQSNVIRAYFPIGIIAFTLLSMFFIVNEENKKKEALLFLFVNTLFSFTLAFGYRLPFYASIPFSDRLVPGRLLTQATIGAVILTSYFFYNMIVKFVVNRKTLTLKHCTQKICWIFIITVLLFYLASSYSEKKAGLVRIVDRNDFFEPIFSGIETELGNFEKGRLAWFGDNFGSLYVYFSYLADYNIISGWNIEGTSVSDYLVFQNVALKGQKKDYILKNILDMNVQICMINEDLFPWLVDILKENGFNEVGSSDPILILKKDVHSYFFKQDRNALVVGKASNLFLSDYPWFAKGNIANPIYYNESYYDDYDAVYFCEPEVANASDLRDFENLIKNLAEKKKRVYIEFGREEFPAPILGVTPAYVALDGNYTVFKHGQSSGKILGEYSSSDRFVQLLGLDENEYYLARGDGNHEVGFFGTRNIKGTDVYFVGGPFNQLKRFAVEYLTGREESSPYSEERDEMIYYILEESFRDIDLYKSLELPMLNVENTQWGRNDCTFDCDLKEETKAMISITYSPRWQVEIDNEQVPVQRVDNMLSFYIPEGRHKVSMIYKMSTLGKIGIGITFTSFLFVLLIARRYDETRLKMKGILLKLQNYLS
jgi:hypothetical protein